MNNAKEYERKKPTSKEMKNLIFAFNVCRYVKSNGIVLVANETTTGIGSGQPSRLDSCKIAIDKALGVSLVGLLVAIISIIIYGLITV